jgi:hypothetical protein
MYYLSGFFMSFHYFQRKKIAGIKTNFSGHLAQPCWRPSKRWRPGRGEGVPSRGAGGPAQRGGHAPRLGGPARKGERARRAWAVTWAWAANPAHARIAALSAPVWWPLDRNRRSRFTCAGYK